MRAQMRPRAPNMRLKGAQETPKSAPKLPKSCPRAPQTRPRQAREAPKPLQNRARQAPRRVLAAIVQSRLVRKAPGAFFCDFSRCARCLRPVFRPWRLQNPLRNDPEPSKIEAGARQDAKKTTKRRDKRSKTRKMRPRSAQERKMCQHGPPQESPGVSRWDARPSP